MRKKIIAALTSFKIREAEKQPPAKPNHGENNGTRKELLLIDTSSIILTRFFDFYHKSEIKKAASLKVRHQYRSTAFSLLTQLSSEHIEIRPLDIDFLQTLIINFVYLLVNPPQSAFTLKQSTLVSFTVDNREESRHFLPGIINMRKLTYQNIL